MPSGSALKVGVIILNHFEIPVHHPPLVFLCQYFTVVIVIILLIAVTVKRLCLKNLHLASLFILKLVKKYIAHFEGFNNAFLCHGLPDKSQYIYHSVLKTGKHELWIHRRLNLKNFLIIFLSKDQPRGLILLSYWRYDNLKTTKIAGMADNRLRLRHDIFSVSTCVCQSSTGFRRTVMVANESGCIQYRGSDCPD